MTVFGDAPAKPRHRPDGTTRAERFFNRLFSKKEIVNCDRDVYLHRWYVIRTAPFALFIHKFVRSDEDRALHDHPWPFIVIPIWRGYIEHTSTSKKCWLCDGHGFLPPNLFGPNHVCSECKGVKELVTFTQRRVWPIIGTRLRPGTYKHRVELLVDERHNSIAELASEAEYEILPSWSIFIRFREFRDWGFHMPEGWIQWNKFWQEKCE